jgi:hypothetical protein
MGDKLWLGYDIVINITYLLGFLARFFTASSSSGGPSAIPPSNVS